MAGVSADVGVVAGLLGGAEVEGVFGAGIDDGDVGDDGGEVGDVALFAGLGIVEHFEGGFANFLDFPRIENDEIVRHDVGVAEFDREGLAGFGGEFLLLVIAGRRWRRRCEQFLLR